MKEEYWIGNDGVPIAVGDMTEDPMRNCLRKLIRENRIISSKKLYSYPIYNSNKKS